MNDHSDQPAISPATQSAFTALMRLREGCETTVYLDSLGNPTVGIGHLVVDADNLSVGDTIDDARVDALFTIDGAAALNRVVELAAEAGIADEAFLPYLASVCFQLGSNWTAKFPNTWAAICEGRYPTAAAMVAASKWAEETPVRAQDFQTALRALPPKGTPA